MYSAFCILSPYFCVDCSINWLTLGGKLKRWRWCSFKCVRFFYFYVRFSVIKFLLVSLWFSKTKLGQKITTQTQLKNIMKVSSLHPIQLHGMHAAFITLCVSWSFKPRYIAPHNLYRPVKNWRRLYTYLGKNARLKCETKLILRWWNSGEIARNEDVLTQVRSCRQGRRRSWTRNWTSLHRIGMHIRHVDC